MMDLGIFHSQLMGGGGGNSFQCYPELKDQRRHSVIAGGYKVILNWFEWTVLPHAIH
jgi:hypothetical protein